MTAHSATGDSATGGLGLAATKLHPPKLPDQMVHRSRLHEMLDAALESPIHLVLASAPAGSGKSTLLASWLANRSEPVAWLQVEESDSDPARFWSYLIEAIAQIRPQFTQALGPTIVGSQADEAVLIPALINELAKLEAPLVMLIDDYHLIESMSVHQGMERLIELCPDQITIVLSTRIDPPFRLGRLRVRNHLVEIRGDDLRFDSDEAAGLLDWAGVSLESTLLGQLCDRTEGWAAGLVLAGLSLRRSSDPAEFIAAFRGDDQLVVDYLSDEFLHGVTPEHRQRLLETSILQQFTGSLVNAVTDTSGGTEWITDTATANQLVIGLDRTGTWFRFHHLLRDLLRLEAQRTFPRRMPELHQRAATWFETQDDFGQAIAHRLAAGDLDRAAEHMLVHGQRLLAIGQIETLRGLLEQLGDVAKSRSWCSLLYAWCEFIDGRYSSAEDWLDVTLKTLPDDFDETVTTPLRMNVALGRGDVTGALEIARRITDPDQLRSHPADLATVSGVVYTWAGQAKEAREALRLAINKTAEDQIWSAHVLAHIYLAMVEFDDGETKAASGAADLALDVAGKHGLDSYYRIAPAYAVRARTGTDPERCRLAALHAVEVVRRTTGDLALGYVFAMCGDTLTDLGDETGLSLIAEARTVIDRCPDPGIAGRYLDRVESRHQLTRSETARSDGSRPAKLVESLTERETAVLRYLPTKMSQREIASELYVSLNTVKTHASAIYRKLGVSDRKAAVQAARDYKLL